MGPLSAEAATRLATAAIAALHAAALEPDLFTTVTLRGMPTSWSDVVKQKAPRGQFEWTVHGALKDYDLPDLVRSLGDKIKVEN